MRKLSLLLLLSIALIATSAFAQKGKLGILTPRGNEVMMIDKKSGMTAPDYLKDIALNKVTETTGIIDTVGYPGELNTNFGGWADDIFFEWFDPGADCIIKEVWVCFYAKGSQGLTSLQIFKTDYPDNVPDDAVDGAGWAGFYGAADGSVVGATSAAGAWQGPDWSYDPLKEEIWGFGGFPVNIPDETPVWVGTNMNFLGAEPEVKAGERFGVVVNFLGSDYDATTGRMAIYSTNFGGTALPNPGLKFYGKSTANPTGGPGGSFGYFIRSYIWGIFAVVEFTSNTPPAITPGGPYGSVLNSDAKTIEASMKDQDAANPATAGVASAKLYYKVNDGAEVTVDMTLASGTDTDGTWEGVIPAGYMNPGDILTYWYEATDKAGASTTATGGSFGYFQKNHELLMFYNDDGTSYSWGVLEQYYTALYSDYMYDVWTGTVDGALSADLLNQYNHIVQLDGYSPATMNDDAVGAWFAAGGKNLFWSSQEWGYSLTGGADQTFAADDWHNMYMGIGTIGPMDINANYTEPFPINAVAGDPITGGLAEFMGDSLQLYVNTVYELGWNDWCDAMTAAEGATVCFTDSAEGRTMGVYRENAGNKGVFMTFDPLTLDTQPSYYWTEAEVHSVVKASLEWFGTPVSVKENGAPGVITNYSLSQNYPNPFNPETKISFSIAKTGNVSLAVYNVVGQKVADLVNEQRAAGNYQITWNANDLASGVYFYRLEVGDYTRTLKMMLLR